MSFSDAEHAAKRKQTRREKFLLEMDKSIPWKRLEERIAPHYPKLHRGITQFISMLQSVNAKQARQGIGLAAIPPLCPV
ncbi:hypothetical protein Ga0074115_11835 [endosymbiont of Ridgeia piscesae]|uniref:Transposase, IS5 family n=1 Tax=endosymbiont of Ridgeia piscesae TaxID=54398 RepID=A0A0T5YY14_9GAMM|nr:hypothetical protein [endosymbiont of Ridgeia piscesae]KRT55443.1 hypothetical protein Ga0074115_11835 [endosymbiont of Ridgeia piscesae]KRT58984.1 hypothetical protein Ga0076813_14604 [endosymbiont of Ridgeia piscesae]